ncbi:hypothetical protein SDC9_80661 [bioreactor metagenome]|uniref:Uncharacterized protein n=1 Tax=bioreactor metagenome TaxID=1076179 RepID=A0A644YZP9_9ZZZZ
MGKKPLVLDGHRGVPEILGDIRIAHPYPVFVPVQGLHLGARTGVRIGIIHGGG